MTTKWPEHPVLLLLDDTDRDVLGDIAASTTEDERIAAFFRVGELDVAADIHLRLKAHLNDIRALKLDAEERGHIPTGSAHQPAERHLADTSVRAALTLVRSLDDELTEAEQAMEEGNRLRLQIALTHETAEASPTHVGVHRPPALLESLSALHHQLASAGGRVHDLLTDDRRVLLDLALEEERRRQAAQSGEGFDLAYIDRYCRGDFFELIADLAEGTPHPMPNDDCYDHPVTATTSDGEDMIFFAKHLPVEPERHAAPPLPPLGVHEVTRLSAIARRHFPRATAVVVTNGRLSRPAERHAQDVGVQLIGREGLERWATWRTPLQEVLGSCEEHTRQEASR